MDEGMSLDTRLLSDAVIELNISRHNVSIYPRNHPIVDKSMKKAYEHFEKLFEFTPEVTISVAKDTLIVDDKAMDKKHPVYQEFALSLSKLNVAAVTFMKGLTLDELYLFHRFLLEDAASASSDEIRKKIDGYGFKRIRIELVDYSAFSLTDRAKGGGSGEKVSLWEKYVYGLLHGGLDTGGDSSELRDVSPESLAELINKFDESQISTESYDKVISSYVRTTSEMAFTAGDLQKLVGFIDNLKPELKRQFLSSAMHSVSKDIESARKALSDMPVEEVIHLLEIANDQMLVIPDALKHIMEKFSMISQRREVLPRIGSNIVDDDIIFSEEITGLLSEVNFKQFVSEAYKKEIFKIIDYKAPVEEAEALREYGYQWSDEYQEGVFHHILLDLISPERDDLLTDDDRRYFMGLLVEKAEGLLETGRFVEITQTILSLEQLAARDAEGTAEGGRAEMLEIFHSPGFLKKVAESIRLMGRQVREGTFVLCDYYSYELIPYLMKSLIEEDSQSVRRFLITLIVRFGAAALPEITAYLDDDRWFVRRNMLFILSELIEVHEFDELVIKKIRKLCRHSNLKVSAEALKCLMKTGDKTGIKILHEYLVSEDDEMVRKAMSIAGTFRVRETVPELLRMLSKKAIKGADLDDKIPVVRALGRIADERALPALKEILSMKSFLYRSRMEKLKGEASEAIRQFKNPKTKSLDRGVGV